MWNIFLEFFGLREYSAFIVEEPSKLTIAYTKERVSIILICFVLTYINIQP